MSVYKVPQDVEAEDKLLGPFSFKQFIFLMISVVGFALAYALAMVVLPLGIIPLPVAFFFGILALPLKKEQPMEVYFAAIISFMLKPKKRLWQPDGIERLVEVVAPKVEEKTYGNGYSQEEVQRRLSYLSTLVDSHGWSIRGVEDPNSSMQADLYNEAQATEDFLDENSTTAQNISHLIHQSDEQRRKDVVQKMAQTHYNPGSTAATAAEVSTAQSADDIERQLASQIHANPYPTMHQATISPLSETSAATPTPQISINEVSPAIIDLANNHNDLSIETIQREAQRIKQQEEKAMEEEVVISLH